MKEDLDSVNVREELTARVGVEERGGLVIAGGGERRAIHRDARALRLRGGGREGPHRACPLVQHTRTPRRAGRSPRFVLHVEL